MITLYSTNCPRCNVLEKKLDQRGIKYSKVTDFDPEFLVSKGFATAPILYNDETDTYMRFEDAVKFINSK